MKITMNGRPFNPRDFAKSLESAVMKAATEAMETRARAAAASLVDPETGKHPIALAWPTPRGVQLSTTGSDTFAHVLEQRLTNEQILTEPETPTTPLVYLAHASEDKAIMRPLAHRLLKEGVDVWYDEWEIGPGDSLRRKMDDGLGRCTHFMVLLTETSLRKPWVAEEIDAGFVRKVEGSAKFIPIRHELSIAALPPLMRGMLSPEVSPDNEPSMQALVANILGLSAKPPLGAPRYVRRVGALQHFAPAAVAIAGHLVGRSESAQEMAPQVTLAEVAEATGLSLDDVEIGMHDLVEGGYLKSSGHIGEDIFWPLGPLFVTFDQHFRDWIPVEDARAIAAEMINGGKDQYDAQHLHERLGWPVRRMNAALWAVQAGGLARTYSVMSGPGGLVISHLMVTPATKRAARA
jgi:hypothetical protein